MQDETRFWSFFRRSFVHTEIVTNRRWARILEVESEDPAQSKVGQELSVRAKVLLGMLQPTDVSVELYLGRVDAKGDIVEADAFAMEPAGMVENGVYLFKTGAVPCRKSGLHGYTVRVLPQHSDLTGKFIPGLITWAEPVE